MPGDQAGEDVAHKDAVFATGGYGPEERFTLSGVREKDSPFLTNPDSVYGPRELLTPQHPEMIDRFAYVRNGEWAYILRGTGPDELYDLQDDSDMTRNRIADPVCREALLTMKERLLHFYLRTSDSVSHTIDDRLCAAAWDPQRGLRK